MSYQDSIEVMAAPARTARRSSNFEAGREHRRSWVRRSVLGIAVAIAGLAAAGYFGWHRWSGSPSVPETKAPITAGDMISQADQEARYGIKITLIAVTGGGGIVDFRYQIADPQKAASLLNDPSNTPILTAVNSGLTLSPTQMGRHHSQMGMKRGAIPFTFYPNVRGAVIPGAPVSVAFGKVRVEPILAQ
ncbi:MAG: hypothetical protein FIA97_02410 [Methylococcaceae bacterium]|nr:hypothetical protein [Methylococcaceae bacterium]